MKVVHIITRLIIGGAQQNTLLTAEDQQRDDGDEVILIAGPGLGPEGSLVERARRNDLDLRLIPQLQRAVHPWRDWTSYRQILAWLGELRPEIVHTHSSKAGILGRAAAGKLGIPAVHTIHGASFHRGQSPWAQRLYIAAEKWAAHRTAKFISVCDAMTENYLAAGIAPAEKFITISSGMEVAPFLNSPCDPQQTRRELGLQPDHIVVGKVARLFHLKGHEYVIAAAKKVVAHNPHVRFLFVGDGSLRRRFEDEVARSELTDYFVFAGLVPPERIPAMIHAMDIVVHTSLWEGLARVLPQALIAGKPVISYDIDGAGEVVIPGETGYLLPPESVDELAEAVIELAENADRRRQLGQTGRDRFTEQFRHQRATQRIREVYRSVIGP